MKTSPREAVWRLVAQYDSEARAYRKYWSPVLAPIAQELVRRLPARPTRRILDVGAGWGSLLPLLEARYPDARVLGIDRSEGMLGLGQGAVAIMDACELALRAGQFDLAVINLALFHFPDAVGALAECRRTLKQGGAVAVTTWASDLDAPIVHIWNDELARHGAIAAAAVERLANHELMDSPAKVTNLLEAAGFASAQAEARSFVHPIRLDEFVNLRTSVGGSRVRFESLDEDSRQGVLKSFRRRASALRAADFELRMQLIFASAVNTAGTPGLEMGPSTV